MKTFHLLRAECAEDGVWGVLVQPDSTPIAHTLEHAYMDGSIYRPKLLAGTYTMTRGTHALSDGKPFDAYCVPPFVGWDGKLHVDVLIHPGNFERDSSGCILIGDRQGTIDGMRALLSSRVTFFRFMQWCTDPQIQLVVEDIA